MWIAIAIIIGVYLALSTLEAIRNCVFISPVKLHSQQSETISTLSNENDILKRRLKVPEVSQQEKRRRELVSTEVKKLEAVGRMILRHIHDQGQVNAMALSMDSPFNEMAVNNFIARAMPSGLILYQNHIISIKPELGSALEFVFSSEYDKDLKD